MNILLMLVEERLFITLRQNISQSSENVMALLYTVKNVRFHQAVITSDHP